MTTRQVRFEDIRPSSASPRPPCDGTRLSFIWLSPRQTPAPSCPYPSHWLPTHATTKHEHRVHSQRWARANFPRPSRRKLSTIVFSCVIYALHELCPLENVSTLRLVDSGYGVESGGSSGSSSSSNPDKTESDTKTDDEFWPIWQKKSDSFKSIHLLYQRSYWSLYMRKEYSAHICRLLHFWPSIAYCGVRWVSFAEEEIFPMRKNWFSFSAV